MSTEQKTPNGTLPEVSSLYKLISELQEDKWNYYAEASDNVAIPLPFATENTSVNFIKQYFKKGGKEEAVKDFNIESFLMPRADHTVSIFFLGVLLYDKTVLKHEIKFSQKVSELYEFFQFIWFVTCLSHDAAFYLEHDKDLYKKCVDLNALKKHLKIEYDLTACNINDVPEYMFRLCGPYFSFRHKHRKFTATDHGIYAGILLYDRLVKNRIIKKAESNKQYLWEEYLDAEYAYAAATVAVHNIWFPAEKDFQLYEKYDLHDLIGKQPIKLKESPLLFLLGLVDTIDPVKAYACVAPTFVLENVYLEFLSNKSFRLKLSPALNFQIMKEKADYLQKWLDVHVEPQESERTLTITFS